jgi:hypothetical protein
MLATLPGESIPKPNGGTDCSRPCSGRISCGHWQTFSWTDRILLAAQQPKGVEKKLKNRTLHWSSPMIDAPVRSRISSLPCVLASVLEKAGRAHWRQSSNLRRAGRHFHTRFPNCPDMQSGQ